MLRDALRGETWRLQVVALLLPTARQKPAAERRESATLRPQSRRPRPDANMIARLGLRPGELDNGTVAARGLKGKGLSGGKKPVLDFDLTGTDAPDLRSADHSSIQQRTEDKKPAESDDGKERGDDGNRPERRPKLDEKQSGKPDSQDSEDHPEQSRDRLADDDILSSQDCLAAGGDRDKYPEVRPLKQGDSPHCHRTTLTRPFRSNPPKVPAAGTYGYRSSTSGIKERGGIPASACAAGWSDCRRKRRSGAPSHPRP